MDLKTRIATKRAKRLLKVLIGLVVVIAPILVMLGRMDLIEVGGASVIRLKTYDTLYTRKEKKRRGDVWFKIWAYNSALAVYTDLLFEKDVDTLPRQDYGRLDLLDKEEPDADMMFYRWCVCLSKLNKRKEGLAACSQFDDEFPDSPLRGEIEKLRRDLQARQL